MRFSCQNETLIPQPLLSAPQETLPISQIESLPQPDFNPNFNYNQSLQEMLTGKQLLLDDLPFPLNEIQSHYENGYLIYRKSITLEKGKPTCVRCGNHESYLFAAYPCARCGENCFYCRKCIMMGRTSTCTPLISWTGSLPERKADLPISEFGSILQWSGTLSAGQQHASTRVAEAIHSSESLLVWAVCGAGKTEVLFNGIDTALMAGKRVCLATPRTDVVLD